MMKNSSDYGNGPPIDNENGFNHRGAPTGYADFSTYQNYQKATEFEKIYIKSEPLSPKGYSQSPFYPDGFSSESNAQYSFISYNQENNSNKMNAINPSSSFRHHPYNRPISEPPQASACNSGYLHNATPSPSPKQCDKCGIICDTLNQFLEHVNNCQQSTSIGNATNFQNYNMLSGGEIIKSQSQSEILDLDSYKVHHILPENDEKVNQSRMIKQEWNLPNENQNVYSAIEERMYMQQDMQNRMIYQGTLPTHENVINSQDFETQGFNVEQNTTGMDESPSPAKSANWKSNESRKPKTYNCTACKKWFTSSGHLKRHYNTTLHKNAVKTSCQPDPANLPVSVHHHPRGEQNRVINKQLIPQTALEDSERPRSSTDQYDVPITAPINQEVGHHSLDDSPNVQADPSVTESRGLLSINNHIPFNPTASHTFNHTINNGFIPPMVMPIDTAYYQMPPNMNAPHSSPVIIINDPTNIGTEECKFAALTTSADNSQPLPSFSQIQRFGQIPYYADVGGETHSTYDLTSFSSSQAISYYEEPDDQRCTLVAPPDSTSTDGDLLPITSSVNNNNLIIDNEEILVPNIKYNIHCSSPESSNGPPDFENSSPQISSTSNIVKPQPLHKCFDCDKVFNKSCYLTQHNKTFHCGDKPFKCVRCGKRFSCEQQHLEHQAKHGGEKPHKCEQCPKQFNHKTDLRRHMCLHTGKKPFICDLCGKGFIRKDHMIKHGDTHLKKPSKIGISNSGLHTRNH